MPVFERLRRDERGFTLIEMMVVLAIIALIAVFAIPNIAQALQNGRLKTVEAQARQIQVAFDEYYNDYVAYPPSAANSYDAFFGSGGYLTQYVSVPDSESESMFAFRSYTSTSTNQPTYTMVIEAKNVNVSQKCFQITKDAVTRVTCPGSGS